MILFIFILYPFSQLPVSWDQNEKAPTRARFIPRLSQGGTIQRRWVKVGIIHIN